MQIIQFIKNYDLKVIFINSKATLKQQFKINNN